MYIYPPVNYIEPVFRPPSEAHSLILQVTNGCSWNKCTFCEMYTEPQKKFRPKNRDEVIEEIKRCAGMKGIRRVFLADGDAMALSFDRLKEILQAIKEHLPQVTRISSYCLPRNLLRKSVEELEELKRLGLQLLYLGAESGDDEVLTAIDKGETYTTTRDALLKVSAAGIKTSVMFINGIGGARFSEQHAIASAKLANDTQPDYLATLVLFFRQGPEKVISGFNNDFQQLTPRQLIEEMEIFISHLELEKSIFRSDHASNYLVLKGVLNRDKERLLNSIREILASDSPALRSEFMRGL